MAELSTIVHFSLEWKIRRHSDTDSGKFRTLLGVWPGSEMGREIKK